MATLEKIRNHAGLLVIAIGLALLAFLLGDFLNQGSTIFRDSKMNAVVINGEKIKIHDYEARVNQAMEMYRMQSNNASLSDEETNQLRNQVYSAMVAEHVLDAQAEKLGMKITPAETFDLVQGDFISPVILQSSLFVNPETGAFDKAGLLNFLKTIDASKIDQYPAEQRGQIEQYRQMWITTENNVRDYRMSEKFSNLLAKAVVANKLEVADEMASSNEVADMTFVAHKAIAVSDSIVTVTDKDLQKFIDDHKESFKTERGRFVDVIYASIQPSKEDADEAQSEINKAREELVNGSNPSDVVSEYSDVPMFDAYMPLSFYRNELFTSDFADQLAGFEKGQVSEIKLNNNTYSLAKLVDKKVAPDSLFVRQIVIPAGAPGASADSVFNVVKADPSKFQQMAVNHSLDQNSASRGGEIGWMTEFMASRYIDNEFKDAIFSAQVGTPFKFTSRYGEHILLVEKATTPVTKYLVAYVNKAITPSSKTNSLIYNEMSSFLTKNKNVKGGLDSLAVAQGYQVLSNIPVFASQPSIAQGVDHSRELVRWAMENKQGSVSDVKEAGDKFVFAIIRKEIPEGYMTLADAREQIYPAVVNQAKVDKMYEDLKAANYSSLQQYAQKINQPIDTVKFVQYGSNRIEGIGFEPAINAVAAFAPLNKPVPVKGIAGVYLVNVYNRAKDNDPQDEKSVKGMLEANRQGVVRMTAIQALIQKAKIEDNRYRFY